MGSNTATVQPSGGRSEIQDIVYVLTYNQWPRCFVTIRKQTSWSPWLSPPVSSCWDHCDWLIALLLLICPRASLFRWGLWWYQKSLNLKIGSPNEKYELYGHPKRSHQVIKSVLSDGFQLQCPSIYQYFPVSFQPGVGRPPPRLASAPNRLGRVHRHGSKPKF